MKSITTRSPLAAALAAVALALVHPFAGLAAAAAIAAVAIAAARQRVHRAVAERDRHLAETAHELRTPLTSVLSALELVRSGHATTADEVSEFLAEADLAARHLAHLVNDLLDDAALREGELQLDRRDLVVDALLTEASLLLQPIAARRGVSLRFAGASPTLRVHTDGRRFQQVLLNLAANALKHSPEGAAVEVQVTAAPHHVRFAVLDAGPGVAEEVRARLFTAFGTARGRQAAGGTGLGLFIARRLVQHLDGRIGYAPGPGGGSVFWFELPRADRDAAVAPAPATAR